MEKPHIGIVGLGSMGMGIANSLLRNGFPVRVFDMNSSLCEKAIAAGAIKSGTHFHAFLHELDVILIVVVNADQVESVLFGHHPEIVPSLSKRLSSRLKSSCVVINHSTISAEKSKFIANKLYKEDNIDFIDAPMSGGSVKASEGKLTLMISGNSKICKKYQPVFDGYAENVYTVGEAVGMGSTVKTIHQLLAGVHIAVTAEAMAMAVKAGIPLQTMYDVVTHAAGNSWMFENRGIHIVNGDFTPHSAVDIFVKDLSLVLETGKTLEMKLPLASTAYQMFKHASDLGYGKLDDSAVVKIFDGVTLPNVDN